MGLAGALCRAARHPALHQPCGGSAGSETVHPDGYARACQLLSTGHGSLDGDDRQGEVFQAPFCIMATGNLSLPRVPRLPGLESFKGNWYHSGLWPEEGVDFSGRRVGVIGTGSSGIQMIPIIAEQAGHLIVFQRTANFSVPAVNRPITPELIAVIRTIRYWRDEAKRTPFGISGHPPPTRSALEVAPEERDRVYEEKWDTGGNISFLYAYNDLLVNAGVERDRVGIRPRQDPQHRARSESGRVAVAARSSDRNQAALPDNGYFETFNRDNVTLVDVKSDPIAEDHAVGLADPDARIRVRRHRVCDRFRCHHRGAARHRYFASKVVPA